MTIDTIEPEQPHVMVVITMTDDEACQLAEFLNDHSPKLNHYDKVLRSLQKDLHELTKQW